MENNDLNNVLEIKNSSNLKNNGNLQINTMPIYEKVLKIMANWLLIMGIISSIIVFFTIGLDSLNAHGHISYYFNFNGFLISISILLGSITTWALLHVICNISLGINKLCK